MMKPSTGNLWRHPDFLRLWAGQTISIFGSMIGGTAMSFTAILFLKASPFELGVLSALGMVPAFLSSLFAGAWVDRLARRPLLIAADIGRALALASIPLAAALGGLHIFQVYAVTLLVSVLGIVFELAYQSYLPGLVGKPRLVEGNSKLSASAAVAEFGGFSLAGWLVQLFTAPMAVLIDAVSFIVSVLSLAWIRAPEPPPQPQEHPNLRREIAEGWGTVLRHPLLRLSAILALADNLCGGAFGALVVLYMSRGLGFDPGLLGMTWAVGGLCALVSAALTPRLTRRLGVGPTMIGGLAVSAALSLCVPLASGATLLSVLLLVVSQFGDGFYVAYEINAVSLRQVVSAAGLLGRVNASLRFLSLGAALAGTLLGGLLGEALGPRPVLLAAAALKLVLVLALGFTPLWKVKEISS